MGYQDRIGRRKKISAVSLIVSCESDLTQPIRRRENKAVKTLSASSSRPSVTREKVREGGCFTIGSINLTSSSTALGMTAPEEVWIWELVLKGSHVLRGYVSDTRRGDNTQ